MLGKYPKRRVTDPQELAYGSRIRAILDLTQQLERDLHKAFAPLADGEHNDNHAYHIGRMWSCVSGARTSMEQALHGYDAAIEGEEEEEKDVPQTAATEHHIPICEHNE